MSLEISLAEKSDLRAIASLEKQLFGCHGYPDLFFRQAFDCWRNGFYVAKEGNGVLGYLLMVPSDDSSKKEAWVLSLGVADKAQGRGIGRQLLKHGFESATPYTRIVLTVAPENRAALTLYQSFGFELEQQEQDYFLDGEARLVMAANR